MGMNFDPFANYRPVPGDPQDAWSCRTRCLRARANMLCTLFSLTERFKFSLLVRQRLKVVRLG